ncbi:MAG TPA: hypothetical protein VKD90_00020 [Gemmataceae bacterium]|nr:hypothetical protein [Gemmataceae bacterium]
MAHQLRRFVPRLEAFDNRIVPTVQVLPLTADGTLTILGDDATNVISISDTGKDPASLIIEADGQFYFVDGFVTRIQVFTADGDDTVVYQLSSDLATSRTVSVDLGLGNDSFTASLDGQTVAAGADLVIQAVGGGGKDSLTLNASGVNVGAGAHLTVDFQGGRGHDGVAFNYTPNVVDPTAVVSLTADQRIR